MSTELIIAGEMGKGGGGSTEAKDTLISEQTVKTLFAVGEGIIEGVDDIFLDTVSISSFDADYEVRYGMPSQTVISNSDKGISFSTTESPLPGFTSKTIIRDSIKTPGNELPNVSTGIVVNAVSLVANTWYRITSLGTTNFKLVGSPSNALGTVFKATGAGTGTGATVRMQSNYVVPTFDTSIPFEETLTSVRLTFSVSTLSAMDGAGNLLGSWFTFEIYTRPNTSSTWARYGTDSKGIPAGYTGTLVKGKTTHGYTFERTIPRPTAASSSTGPWQVRVIRTREDSNSSKKQNIFTWNAVTQIYEKGLSYDDTALVGIILRDATQFGNRIPEVMFKVKGKRLRLPINYNPTTRVYTGNWDGTLYGSYKQYSNNPAWVLFDVLTDTRAGLGIPDADIDKYSIYNLGKYADELLLTGYSAPVVCLDNGELLEEARPQYIPRFTLDYSFQTREGVKDFLSQILSLCNANLITNEFGQLAVIFQQRGQVVKRIVNNSNVVDGVFTYQSSNIEQRTNLVNVTYNRGLNFGRTDTVTVSDDGLIDRYGLRPTDIVLPGCYYEEQAIRKARWALYTNCYFTDFITFSVFLDGMTYKIGDLIRVCDIYNRTDQQAGIIVDSSTVQGTTVLTLDRPIVVTEGTYTFFSNDSNNADITKTIIAPFNSDTIILSEIRSVPVGTVFAVSSVATAKLYRVTSITKSEDQQYSITALEFDEAIFDYIDSGINLEPKVGDYAGIGTYGTIPVTQIFVKENFGTNGTYATGRLQVSWTWDLEKTQKYTAKYKLTWAVDDGTPTIIETITSDTYDIINPVPGIYSISVWAVNPFSNFYSKVTTLSYAFRTEAADSTLLHPINVRIAGTEVVSPQPNALEFTTPELTLAFDYNPANQNVDDALYDYLVEIWDSAGLNKIESYSINPTIGELTTDPTDSTLRYKPLNGNFALPFNRNVNIFAGTAARTFKVKIYSRDTLGDLSLPIVVTVSNPVPVFTSFTITPDFGKVRLDIEASEEIDVKEYFIYRGPTAAFVPHEDNLFYKGPSNSISLTTPNTSEYFYKCAISDSFGNIELNYSSAKAARSISGGADFVTITGEQFFTYAAGSETPRNPSITLTATLHGVLTTYLWGYWNGSNWANLPGTNNGKDYTLTPDITLWGSSKILRIRCLSGELAGEITICKVTDGAKGEPGIQGISPALFGITNAGAIFKRNSAGVISPAGLTLTTNYQNIAGPITYQWQKDDVNILGATASSYTVPATDYNTSVSNNYKVTITGSSVSLSDTITIPSLDDGGSSAVVLLSNGNINFGGPNIGYSNIDFSNGTCDITAYMGSLQLTYATSGANTFSLTYTVAGATVNGGTNPTNKIFRVPAPTAMSSDSAVVTITVIIRDSTGVSVAFPVVKTLRYNLSRGGVDSTSYWLSATNFLKRSAALVYTPTALTVSGYRQIGASAPVLYSGRFKIYENNSGNPSYTSVVDENTYSYTPSGTAVGQIKVELYLAGGTNTLIDYTTIPVVQDGSNSLTIVEPNSAVLLAAANDGTVASYAGSGTTIQIFEGSIPLVFTTGVVNKGQFGVSPVGSGIAVGAISGNGTTTCTVANHSTMALDVATVTYSLTVAKLDGTIVTLTDIQTIAKSKEGAVGGKGIPGPSGKVAARAYYLQTYGSAEPIKPSNSTDGAAPISPNGWSSTPYEVLGNGDKQWQSDAIYEPGSSNGNTQWGQPYISLFKVGSLQAFGVTTGELTSTTAGDEKLTINEGNTSHEFRTYKGNKLVFSAGDSIFGDYAIVYTDTEGTAEQGGRSNFQAHTRHPQSYSNKNSKTEYMFSGDNYSNAFPNAGNTAIRLGDTGWVGTAESCTLFSGQSTTFNGTTQVNVTLGQYGGRGNFAGFFSSRIGAAVSATKVVTLCDTTYAINAVGNVFITGAIVATDNITAYSSSDRNLKENITPISNPLEKIAKISGNTFSWKDSYYEKQDKTFVKREDVGIIAQEIQEVLPEAVHEREDGTLAVAYEKLIPLLIEAVKAQQVQIEELKNGITSIS
jgi:predicted phage tail protein